MPLVHSNRRWRSAWKILVPLLSIVLLGLLVLAALLPKDPAPRTYDPKPLILPETVKVAASILPDSTEVTPEEFVSGLEGTGITVTFESEPLSELGEQIVTLLFSDGTVSCTRQTTCYRFHMEHLVTVDKADGRTADARDFVADENVAVSLSETPKLDTVGEKTVMLVCGERSYPVRYLVTESNPPEGTACTVTAEIGTVPNPASLIEDIRDESAVTVTYKEPPLLTTVGEYPVVMILTDAYGNVTEIPAVIQVIPGADAPKFDGMEQLSIYLGDSISYKKGVTATDPQDGVVSFTVDAGEVDLSKTGSYTAYYSATDADGNTTIMPRTVVVLDANRAAVEDYAREVLAQIITADMTRDQQIHAVYRYTRYHIQYVGTSNKESIWHSAYEGFTTNKGDCYTYYAVNKILLDLLGIENLTVRRTGGTSNHWWNLVLHEDGQYYHVDSCPVAVRVDGVDHGKMTERDLQTYTNAEGVVTRRPNFYVYDHTLPEYQDIPIAP